MEKNAWTFWTTQYLAKKYLITATSFTNVCFQSCASANSTAAIIAECTRLHAPAGVWIS